MKQIQRFIAALFVPACLFMAACANPADPGPAPADTGGLRAGDIEDGGVTLYWDPVSGADSYRIYWSEGDKDPEGAQVIETISTDTTYTMENLSSGAVCYFWVRGLKDGEAMGTFKDPLELRMPVPAPDAAGIALARDMNSIYLLWEPVGGALSYEIWYSLTNRIGTAQEWSGLIDGTSAEVTGLFNNNTYYFWLRSVGAAGPSGYSGVRSETTGEPEAPAKPVIKWTGRLRDALFANWESAANATGYEFRCSAGNNVDTAEHRAAEIKTTAYMAEGLVKGISYNFWVRSYNTLSRSEWSDMGTLTVGEGIPAVMEGTFFSRYPASGGNSRPYYMDGYRIGPVEEMPGVFPFNRAKYPDSAGFPGPLAEAGMVKEGTSGAAVHNDDQYIFYVADGIGGCGIGIVRAVLERTYVWNGRKYYLNYTVIEPFKIPGQSSFTYQATAFEYSLEELNYLMGINGGPTLTDLDLETLQNLTAKNWDKGIAYPQIRLGYTGDGKNLGGPDVDTAFHPELIRPERIKEYLAVKLPNLDSNAAYSYFDAWNEEKGMHNWQDREQFPASELMEYVFW
ncbi:MAG: fibronectin type III domain-containing protein [Treponema sp.]|nr:fibronectin type III domain-containing protein [Treponema sp.]